MDTLVASNSIARMWFENWLWLVGLVIGLAAVFWVLFDSQRTGKKATVWIVLTLLGVAAVLPSFVLRVAPEIGSPTLVPVFLYAGIVGTLLALFALIMYLSGVAVTASSVCPQCGSPLDPSWGGQCPYCQQGAMVEMDTEPVSQPVASQPEPTMAAQPARPPDKTVIIGTKPPHLAYLVVKSGIHMGKVFNLSDVTRIGRDPNPALNDVVLDDPAVSSQHAKIKLEAGEFVIYDLASTNHTYVNGNEILRQPLKSNDTVRIGNTELAFIEVKEEKTSSQVPPAKD